MTSIISPPRGRGVPDCLVSFALSNLGLPSLQENLLYSSPGIPSSVEPGLPVIKFQSSHLFKAIIKAQKESQQTIDKKQDKLIEQLQKNQQALTLGLEDIVMLNYVTDESQKSTKLPIEYKRKMMEETFEADIDNGFSNQEIKKLMEYQLSPSSQIVKESIENEINISDYDRHVGDILKKLGQKKGLVTRSKKSQNRDEIYRLDNDMSLLRKYRDRIKILPEGKKTIEQSIRKPTRNAYKIHSDSYGGLMVNMPKLDNADKSLIDRFINKTV